VFAFSIGRTDNPKSGMMG